MNRHQRRRAAVTQRVKLSDLKPGPLRHLTLPQDLVTRIKYIHSVLGEHYGATIEHWLEGFQRDMHPEKEVAIWESTARAYEKFTKGRDLSPEACREVYVILVSLLAGDNQRSVTLKSLKRDEAQEVVSIAAETWEQVRAETGYDDKREGYEADYAAEANGTFTPPSQGPAS